MEQSREVTRMGSASVKKREAVLLLSGGLDSYTAGAVARRRGWGLVALTVGYGQRHSVELDAARAVARDLGVEHHYFQTVDLRAWGGSALTGPARVPKGGSIGRSIPATYVPARNTILLSLALGLAEARGLCDIIIGVNALDYSGYPDCRPPFIRSFQQTANLATRAAVAAGVRFRIQTPLIRMTKARIIRTGLRLGCDYSLTWSCYDPQRRGRRPVPCLRCDSCRLRAKGFHEAGVPDPLEPREGADRKRP
ncbi:MAG: 7-cyano-7-deazaguanine synthase QueC [Acidobacteriota bacterium]